MNAADILNEWKCAEIQIRQLAEQHFDSGYTRRKLLSYFYARWMTGSRIPVYLKHGLSRKRIDAVHRFMRDVENNDEYFIHALNLVLRKHGYKRLRSDIDIGMLGAAMAEPVISGLAFTNHTGELTDKQLEKLEMIVAKHSAPLSKK
ncbi:hypothetical protein CZP2022_32 [Vibrio phage C-ZP2022]|nr:hypothetical protein CZP2022_32 [Vibrio phage C-ZP2022]